MSDPFNQFNSKFDAMFAPTALAVGLAVAGTLTRHVDASTIPCTLIVDRAEQLYGDQAQVVNIKTTITAYVADLGGVVPERHDTFSIGDDVFRVESILEKEDDSSFICTVTEFCQ